MSRSEDVIIKDYWKTMEKLSNAIINTGCYTLSYDSYDKQSDSIMSGLHYNPDIENKVSNKEAYENLSDDAKEIINEILTNNEEIRVIKLKGNGTKKINTTNIPYKLYDTDGMTLERVKKHFHYGQISKLFRNVFESVDEKITNGEILDVVNYIYKEKPLTLNPVEENHDTDGQDKG